jgi:citrate lyase subunit beta/citryl-CoA lyase
MLLMRSIIFVPANRANMVARAHQTPADVVLLDLEDSVAPAEKQAARAGLRDSIASLKAAGKTVHVRVNSLTTGLTRDDLAAAVAPGVSGLVLPKAEAARDIRQVDVLIREQEMRNQLKPGNILLFPHVESARGLLRCEEIAQASSRIAGMSIGGEDYVASLGVPRSSEALEYARRLLVNICSAFGILPLDVIYPAINDEAGLASEAAYARAIGFKGKYVIHPGQVDAVNRAFMPGEAELAAARRVIEGFDAALARGEASVQVDGQMVDVPVAKRARDLLAYAEAIRASAQSGVGGEA